MRMSKSIALLQKYEETRRQELRNKKMEEKYKEVKKAKEYRQPMCHNHSLDEYCDHYCPLMGVEWESISNTEFETRLYQQLHGDFYDIYIGSMKTFNELGGYKILKTPEQRRLWNEIVKQNKW